MEGNMSCAASSGGLGLKMRGRVGPAALNGVGAYLIPPDSCDSMQMSVACVSSGTGEHMTTTLASGLAAERVYQSKAKHTTGILLPCSEHEVLKLFIEKEFLSESAPSSSTPPSTSYFNKLPLQKLTFLKTTLQSSTGVTLLLHQSSVFLLSSTVLTSLRSKLRTTRCPL
jgi:hypothetical protein